MSACKEKSIDFDFEYFATCTVDFGMSKFDSNIGVCSAELSRRKIAVKVPRGRSAE